MERGLRSRTESLHVGLNRTTGCWPHLGVSEFLERVKWGLVDLFTSPFENITENNKLRIPQKGLDGRAVTLALVVSLFMYLSECSQFHICI